MTTKWFFFPVFHQKMHLMQEDAHDTQVKNDFACTIALCCGFAVEVIDIT
ncbi:hypothetical protein P4S88_11925 [Anoxybacillus geothermalis]|nr:hypothetical protein [Anoxybacillus geothermalis]